MTDSKRIKLGGHAVPVRGNDIDTDRIIPARYLRTTVFEGLGENAFEDDRAQLREAGKTHPFDDERFRAAEVLVVNKNFGCGSSREHAPQAIARWGKGIKLIVGESFSEIFYGNCVSLGVPCLRVTESVAEALLSSVEVDPAIEIWADIRTGKLTCSDKTYAFEMSDGVRNGFVQGRWDTTSELLAAKQKIETTAEKLQYFRNFAG